MNGRRGVPRWPLVPIAAPAAVAIWSGWVGLGGMCGFGLVQPFPGIVAWHLDTAITLPVGVEAYGAYALGAWLTPGTPERARKFARRSAIGSLALGMTGQVVYHLLAAAHAHRAPWPVVVVVSCMPVVTLGFGAALTHLLRVPADAPADAAGADSDPATDADTERTEPPDTEQASGADTSGPDEADTARTPPRPLKRTVKRPRGRTQGGRVRRSLADTQAAYLAAMSARPDATVAGLATDMGVSERTVRRIRATLNGHPEDQADHAELLR